jgi:hypothetical protein
LICIYAYGHAMGFDYLVLSNLMIYSDMNLVS